MSGIHGLGRIWLGRWFIRGREVKWGFRSERCTNAGYGFAREEC